MQMVNLFTWFKGAPGALRRWLAPTLLSGIILVSWCSCRRASVEAAGSIAPGDGKHDDYARLQAAINAVAAGHKKLVLSAGVYCVSRPLVIPAGATEWGVELVGEKSESKYQYLPGSTATVIKATAVMPAVVSSSGAYYASIRNIVIDANRLAAVGYAGGYQDRIANCTVIQATRAGIELGEKTNNTRITECTLALNETGLRSAGSDSTTYYVSKTQIRENRRDGIYISNGFTARFSECTIESNGGIGANIKSADTPHAPVWNIVFDACWFEGNGGYVTDIGALGSASNPRYIRFSQCFFNADAKMANIGRVDGVTFDACHFLGTPTAAGYLVVGAANYVALLNSPDIIGDGAIAITGAGAGNVIKFAAYLDGGMKMTQPLVVKGSPTTLPIPTGYVGERLAASVEVEKAVPLVSNTVGNICAVTLTPGRWRLSGAVTFKQKAATKYVALRAHIAAAMDGGGNQENSAVSAVACSPDSDGTLTITDVYVDVPPGVNVRRYLNALAVFSQDSMFAYGVLTAQRVS